MRLKDLTVESGSLPLGGSDISSVLRPLTLSRRYTVVIHKDTFGRYMMSISGVWGEMLYTRLRVKWKWGPDTRNQEPGSQAHMEPEAALSCSALGESDQDRRKSG